MPIAFHRLFHRFLRKYSLFLVYGFVVGAGGLIYFFVDEAHFLSLLFLVLTTVAFVYARFIETHWLRVNTIPFPHELIKHPIRIALLTDLHVGCGKGYLWMENVVERVLALKPDLVLIAGDLVNNQFPLGDETRYLTPLLQLKHLPIYYVLGNHEYGTGNYRRVFFEDNVQPVIQRMADIGIPLLRNELITLKLHDQEIVLFGSDDYWSKPIDYAVATGVAATMPFIFMTHNPDAITEWPATGRQPDLTLAGHAHGGQIAVFRFPLGSATLKLGRKFYQGLRNYKGKPIYISTGLGESTLPLRFGARPEIALIELKPKTAV